MDLMNANRHFPPFRRPGSLFTLYRFAPFLLLALVSLGCDGAPQTNSATAAPPASAAAKKNPFDGTAAYEYLKQICELGPRYSGSKGMTEQQAMLVEHFQKLGAKVTRQEFMGRHSLSGGAVPMTNLIIEWHPDRKDRLLLGAHYDTRPYPDQDRRNPRGTFIGANDGASGVALLMELGKAMPNYEGRYGVDFVLFDAEEFIFTDRDPYCVGSEYFARDLVANPPEHRYHWGVILDMVAGKNMRLLQERYSVSWPETRPLVKQIWGIAARLGVREFIPQVRRVEVMDDHVPLRNIAKIPTCDIIDMDYAPWHTQADVPAQCSPTSLAKVGWVMLEWLEEMKQP